MAKATDCPFVLLINLEVNHKKFAPDDIFVKCSQSFEKHYGLILMGLQEIIEKLGRVCVV